jgi:GLPGLI family protein
MKQLLAICTLALSMHVQAQKVVDKAIIKMKVETTFPENFNPGGGGPDGGGGNFQMPRDIEVNSTVWYKGNFTKMESQSDFGTNQTIIDREAKKTTLLMEMMGRKMGYYSTEADQEAMQKRMDSARIARRDSLEKLGLNFARNEPEITIGNETKTIAGFNCKKAIIKTKNQSGQVSETVVWFTPDFKMGEGYTLNGGGGGGGMMRMMGMTPQGMDKINGFPMEYEITRQNGMKVHMVVTKVQLDAEIADKTFEIPKGYDLKPMSEMGGPGGGMRFRAGGGNNQ